MIYIDWLIITAVYLNIFYMPECSNSFCALTFNCYNKYNVCIITVPILVM